jgi:outer membrane murein-binding lipoprotein Lpp
MSDSDKLDKIESAIKFARENAIVLGFLGTAVPFIFGLGYTAITEINKAKDALSQFTEIVEQFGEVKGKVATLERDNQTLRERLQAQGDQIGKAQDRLTDAVLDSKQAKAKADAVERMTTQELKILGEAMKSELNAIKRATSNRLGN